MNSIIAQPKSNTKVHKVNWNGLIVFLIPFFVSIFSLLIYNLYQSTDDLSVSFINENSNEIREMVQNYVDDMNRLVLNNPTTGYESSKDILQAEENNKYFMPSMVYSNNVTSVVVASSNGNSYMLHRKEGQWMNRITYKESSKKKEIQTFWKDQFSKNNQITKVIDDSTVYNPCTRPWYTLSIKQQSKVVTWTKPYQLQTDHKNGITASTYCLAANGDTIVTAYDILLRNFNRIIQSVSLTANSYGFIVMANNMELIGINDNQTKKNTDFSSNFLLQNINTIDLIPLKKGINYWKKSKSNAPFEMRINNKHWWISFQPIYSNKDNILFYSIIIVPEKDFRATMNQTLNITTGSFIIILLLLIFILSNFHKINSQNKLLQKKRIRIARQKKFIQERNKEILDSIHYTKAIQSSMLPKDEQLTNAFSDHFILYMPKDIVSGDLYWHQPFDDCQMIAAIDCTGHGVPGAVLSMIGYGGLKSATISQRLKQPNKILEHLADVVTSYFLNTSKHQINDGMDIAFTTYYPKDSLIKYAGAKNPILIIRNNNTPLIVDNTIQKPLLHNQNRYLYLIKADRKGIEASSSSYNYKCQSIQAEKNDMIYLFTDGFADQFGGEKGKKLNMKRFKELILETSSYPSMAQQKEHLQNFFLR
ncbi:PP2C family protein-serine/threonine phosphatase [Carboxylicivirga linearis]|uniref:SpoIIE family protein phosphatase n=1 Tax=Carboxylicivirga linearis TaxID=1628157 RepID=A0ABS5JXR9_9BACT|nr:SpoIIE family protein phosphatase [Carboxylicivirga linearis]MBS2099720.1 SpoIIE family protein phosphatase [Carboxylicivirga linearis]